MVVFQGCCLSFWLRKNANNFSNSVKEGIKYKENVCFPSTHWVSKSVGKAYSRNHVLVSPESMKTLLCDVCLF